MELIRAWAPIREKRGFPGLVGTRRVRARVISTRAHVEQTCSCRIVLPVICDKDARSYTPSLVRNQEVAGSSPASSIARNPAPPTGTTDRVASAFPIVSAAFADELATA
jgi:hypothetical protein